MKLDDRYLLEECEDFDFKDPPFDPVQFSQTLVKFMYENNGLGLAANQVGVPYRIFAMRAYPENFVCFNPKIVQGSEKTVTLEEGCLSYPGLIVKVKRSEFVRVRFQTPNGDTMTKQFIGMTARVFQHEYDHLQGERFFDKANRFHREKAMEKWRNGQNEQLRIKA
jgi:peptide deformylase